MLNLIRDNIGNIGALIVLALILFLAIRTIVKNRKSGRGNCSCGCSGCPMSSTCHKKDKE
ncbi:MAG: FeoB-associated Cys-rich membrane protein [Saccharofermentans sp.]|nr:FeoB-associated Cys-rich membrane protein [Saccharofermentans sp.]